MSSSFKRKGKDSPKSAFLAAPFSSSSSTSISASSSAINAANPTTEASTSTVCNEKSLCTSIHRLQCYATSLLLYDNESLKESAEIKNDDISSKQKLALLGYSTYLSRQSIVMKNHMKRVFDTALQLQEKTEMEVISKKGIGKNNRKNKDDEVGLFSLNNMIGSPSNSKYVNDLTKLERLYNITLSTELPCSGNMETGHDMTSEGYPKSMLQSHDKKQRERYSNIG